MTDKKQKIREDIYNKLTLHNPAAWFKFIKINQSILADVCDPCRLLILKRQKRQAGSKLDPGIFCDKCKPMVEDRAKQLMELMKGAGKHASE